MNPASQRRLERRLHRVHLRPSRRLLRLRLRGRGLRHGEGHAGGDPAQAWRHAQPRWEAVGGGLVLLLCRRRLVLRCYRRLDQRRVVRRLQQVKDGLVVGNAKDRYVLVECNGGLDERRVAWLQREPVVGSAKVVVGSPAVECGRCLRRQRLAPASSKSSRAVGALGVELRREALATPQLFPTPMRAISALGVSAKTPGIFSAVGRDIAPGSHVVVERGQNVAPHAVGGDGRGTAADSNFESKLP